jgi:hypothetical protein
VQLAIHQSIMYIVMYSPTGMPPPMGVSLTSPMHPGSVDRKRPAPADPRLAQQMKLLVD